MRNCAGSIKDLGIFRLGSCGVSAVYSTRQTRKEAAGCSLVTAAWLDVAVIHRRGRGGVINKRGMRSFLVSGISVAVTARVGARVAVIFYYCRVLFVNQNTVAVGNAVSDHVVILVAVCIELVLCVDIFFGAFSEIWV